MYTAAWRVNRRADPPFPRHIAFPRVIDAPLSKSSEGHAARYRYIPLVRLVATNQIPLLSTRERGERAQSLLGRRQVKVAITCARTARSELWDERCV